MKKIIICAAIFLSAGMFKEAGAQVRFNVNFNIGSQPVWGPVGYDYVEYYYLPDIESYYYVPTHQFVYLSGSRWVFGIVSPRYRGYNLIPYKVVVNRPNAYRNFMMTGQDMAAIVVIIHNRSFDTATTQGTLVSRVILNTTSIMTGETMIMIEVEDITNMIVKKNN
jgi:hypothetical protein